MSKYQMIAIVAMMRTGSNLLERLLAQHPKISIYGELFNRNFIARPNWQEIEGITLANRNAHYDELLDYFCKRAAPNLPVFRIFEDHDLFSREKVLRDPKIAKIVLKRDPTQSFLSLKRAEATGQWHVSRSELPIRGESHYDESERIAYITRHNRYYEHVESILKDTSQSFLSFNFDDIKSIEQLNKVFEFVSLPANMQAFFEPTQAQTLQTQSAQSHKIVLKEAFIADRVGLAFVPIEGTEVDAQKRRLQKLNRGSLRKVPTEDLKRWRGADPNRRCYTSIIHPSKRAFLLFCAQFYGQSDVFQGKFSASIADFIAPTAFPAPPPKDPREALEMGLTPVHYKRFSKAFLRLLRNELWGFKECLTTDQYWPQALLIENFHQHMPLEIAVEDQVPEGEHFEALSQIPLEPTAWLNLPFKAERIIYSGTRNILFECFKEDFEVLGFPQLG